MKLLLHCLNTNSYTSQQSFSFHVNFVNRNALVVLLNVARHDSFASVVAGEYHVLCSPIITVLSFTQNMILLVISIPYLNSLQNDPLLSYSYS